MNQIVRIVFLTAVWATLPFPLIASEVLIGRSAGWASLHLLSGTTLRVPSDSGETVIGGNRISFEEKSQQVLMLDEDSYRPDTNTDLLLHFDRKNEVNGGYYRLMEDGAHYPRTERKFGPGAALFRKTENEIALVPEASSLLYPDTLWSDFTIEFWLRPQYLEQGETILLWQSSRQIEKEIAAQEIQVYVSGRSLTWRFDNIFLPPGNGPLSIEIEGRTPLVPEQWHHHSLCFNAKTGMLLYQVDGKDEAIRYITATGQEGSSVFLPYIGGPEAEPLRLGTGYTGFLDELRISKSLIEKSHLKPYPLKRGTAETIPIDLGGKHARVVSIEADSSIEGMSRIGYFYRQSDTKSDYEELEGAWKPFVPGMPFPVESKGRFLQLRFEFFPDSTGSKSPMLSEVHILYEQDPPPVPPSLINVVPEDGSLTISWNAVSAHDLSGYLLLYGTAPDDYRGSSAHEGISPINVGENTSITLTGLENGTLYFFRIAAFDNDDPQRPGPLSREVYGRPTQNNTQGRP